MKDINEKHEAIVVVGCAVAVSVLAVVCVYTFFVQLATYGW